MWWAGLPREGRCVGVRGGNGDTGCPWEVPVSLSQEDREGQPRSARLPSRASRHWVRGNSGQLSLPSRPRPASPRRILSQRGCERTVRPRKRGYGLASCERARLAAWPPTPLVSAGAAPVGWRFQPRPRRPLGGAGFREGKGVVD